MRFHAQFFQNMTFCKDARKERVIERFCIRNHLEYTIKDRMIEKIFAFNATGQRLRWEFLNSWTFRFEQIQLHV